jgi:hypothetical protein
MLIKVQQKVVIQSSITTQRHHPHYNCIEQEDNRQMLSPSTQMQLQDNFFLVNIDMLS